MSLYVDVSRLPKVRQERMSQYRSRFTDVSVMVAFLATQTPQGSSSLRSPAAPHSLPITRALETPPVGGDGGCLAVY